MVCVEISCKDARQMTIKYLREDSFTSDTVCVVGSVGFLSIHTLIVSTSVPSLVGGACDDLDGRLFRTTVSSPWHSDDAGVKYVWQFGTRIGGIPSFLVTMRLSYIIAISMWSSCNDTNKADCLDELSRPWAFQCRTRT